MEKIVSLAEAYPREQARLRTIQGHCKEVGSAGAFLWYIIQELLYRADQAVMKQDTVTMIQIYEEMRDIHE